MKMSIEDDEFYVMTDSDEFRACETMAQQETPIKVAVSRLIDFYGMCEEDAHSYYMEALQKNMTAHSRRFLADAPSKTTSLQQD
jgi:hypothetical protein